MVPRSEVQAELRRAGVVAIIRMTETADLVAVSRALVAGGIRMVEVTMTVPDAIEVIREVGRQLGDEVVMGAGTVLDAGTASRAMEAGAAFVVSPCLIPEVVAACREADRLVMPGALTPSEIFGAWSLGADVVKVFPGRLATPEYFADLRGPFPDIPLMPTGNVDVRTAPAYIRAGAVAVGAGRSLVDPEVVRTGDMARITATAAALRRAVDDARGGVP